MPDTGSSTGLEAGLPRSFLRPMLLVALSGTSSHGYDLAEHLWEFGLTGLDLAGIYRALRVMEHEGLVASQWEPSVLGPARRVYSLSNNGRTALAAHAAWLRTARGYLDVALDSVSSP